jgi:CubicO group peptidase (beta-lactamase class C family)
MLVLQLVDQGKIKLDGKITEYLPEYPRGQGDRVSIHQLLTHTSGIPDYGELPNYRDLSRNPFTTDSLSRLFADSTLRFEPGSKFSYSNSGYFLLGMIIEKVTGKPYEQVLLENILRSLNMSNSGYDRHDTILKKRARGYEKKTGHYVNAPYLDMSVPYSTGSLFSTVEDLGQVTSEANQRLHVQIVRLRIRQIVWLWLGRRE